MSDLDYMDEWQLINSWPKLQSRQLRGEITRIDMFLCLSPTSAGLLRRKKLIQAELKKRAKPPTKDELEARAELHGHIEPLSKRSRLSYRG